MFPDVHCISGSSGEQGLYGCLKQMKVKSEGPTFYFAIAVGKPGVLGM